MEGGGSSELKEPHPPAYRPVIAKGQTLILIAVLKLQDKTLVSVLKLTVNLSVNTFSLTVKADGQSQC